MSAPLDDIASYSAYVYALRERHPFVTGSTLTLALIGAMLAQLAGRIECHSGVHLEAWELVDFAEHRIRSYSYEVYRASEKVCWYDAWEHPEIPAAGGHVSSSQARSAESAGQSSSRTGNQFRIAEPGRSSGGCSPGLDSRNLSLVAAGALARESVPSKAAGALKTFCRN